MPAWLKTLFPGYPALVMATGIIAVACKQQGIDPAALALYWITAVAYGVLAVLFIVRLIRFPRDVFEDITHSVKGFTFLTTVAATNVLGSACAVIHGWWRVVEVLWWVSLPLLVVCLYVPLMSGLFRKDPPSLRDGINGTWFLMAVAVESVAVLGALLLEHAHSQLLAFVSLTAFGLGLVLYLVVVTLIFARWTFVRLDPGDIHPPAWIAAGAAAITTLAGSNLIAASPGDALLERLAPFLGGMIILAWATATFWFPLMVAVGIWRHLIRRVSLGYDPSFWAMVFPLGMFSAASYAMFKVLGVDQAGFIYQIALVIAGVAWLAMAWGLTRRLIDSKP